MTNSPHRGHDHHVHDMLPVETALQKILDLVFTLEDEEKSLMEALGQVLAQNIVSSISIPPVSNSAMDGFAIRWSDLRGVDSQNPVTLKVSSYVPAGHIPTESVSEGTAARIMTGAPIPAGADTVIPFEDTDEIERKKRGDALSEIRIYAVGSKGEYVRPAGEDIKRGDIVFHRGTILRPAELGVLASLGCDTVWVNRRPVVAIVATGNELQEPGRPLSPGKIYDSNSYSIAASVLRCGGLPKILGIALDNFDDVQTKLEEALAADLLFTIGGVSKGDYDFVKDVLAAKGEVAFWSVRMRPAKPLAFGVLDAPDGRKVPHIGLPGNPVSALVAFEILARPAILKMLGKTNWERPTLEAILQDPIYNTDGRRVFARVVVSAVDGIYYAWPTGPQGSNLLTSMAKANGLAICPEETPVKLAGDVVTVQMLDWNERE